MDYVYSYTTMHEIDFIDGLGTHTLRNPGISKMELLKKYLDNMALRMVWGNISEPVVAAHVIESLQKERKKSV